MARGAVDVHGGHLLQNERAGVLLKGCLLYTSVDLWVTRLGRVLLAGKGYTAKELKHTFPLIAADFANIPVTRVPKDVYKRQEQQGPPYRLRHDEPAGAGSL